MKRVLVSAVAAVALLFAGLANAAAVDINITQAGPGSNQWNVTLNNGAGEAVGAIAFFLNGVSAFTIASSLLPSVSVPDSVNRINTAAEVPPNAWNLALNPPAGVNLVETGLTGVAIGTFTATRQLSQADAIPGDDAYGATAFASDLGTPLDAALHVVPAPEPTAALLLGLGLAGLGLVRRRTN